MENICSICFIFGRWRSNIFWTLSTFANKTLELFFIDVCRPVKVSSKERAWYFVTIIDKLFRWTMFYQIKNKNDAFKRSCTCLCRAEWQKRTKLPHLQFEGCTAFLGKTFTSFLEKRLIFKRRFWSNTFLQNKAAKRMNQTVSGTPRALLNQKVILKKYLCWCNSYCNTRPL